MSEEEFTKKKNKANNYLDSLFNSSSRSDSSDETPDIKPKKSDLNRDSIPEHLRKFVSEEVWNLWSDARKESYKEMLDNPNKFFYRNRPPGESQKNGQWSEDEQQLFMERMRYFQDELGVIDACWGLFAVPIKGRLGYQCANYYRYLIKEGKIQNERYSVIEGKLVCNKSIKPPKPSSKSLEILNAEALEYLEKTLKSYDGEIPTMEKPVKTFQKNRKSAREDAPINEDDNNEKETIEHLSKVFGKSQKIPDKRYNPMEDHLLAQNIKKSIDVAKKKKVFTQENTCPLVGYLDPLTEEPIKTPMMDPSGVVMDLNSWRAIFARQADPPYSVEAQSEKDLTELNQSNFENYKLQIVNIPC